jgi:Rrf2 family protein
VNSKVHWRTAIATNSRPIDIGQLGVAILELTTKGRYAVMALADLAGHGEGRAVPLSAIAERQQLSVAYLEQIFLKLRRAGLVESERGRSGGYVLSRPAAAITVSEIMSAVAEETRMTRCAGEDGPGCIGEHRCLTHGLWLALGDHIQDFLSSVCLADVLEGRIGDRTRQTAMPTAADFLDTSTQ